MSMENMRGTELGDSCMTCTLRSMMNMLCCSQPCMFHDLVFFLKLTKDKKHASKYFSYLQIGCLQGIVMDWKFYTLRLSK
jgi:hypothetical protein